jgi:hypothetical protein
MATSEILGLFTTPEQYQQNQLAQFQNRAATEVQMSPFQQAALSARTAGYQLGQGIGGALGGTDPQLQMITRRQQLATQLDQSKPESYMRVAQLAAQSGDPQFAIAIADAGRQMQAGMATARKATAEAQKAELTIKQEQDLRDELSKLPPNATEEQILGVVTKYGSPDKVLATLQSSSDKALQRENVLNIERDKIKSRADIESERIEAKKEAALLQAKNDKEREEIRAQAKIDAQKIAADARRDIGKLGVELKRQKANTDAEIAKNKPLAPSLQKDESKDLELVDSLKARSDSLVPAIKLLTVDPTTKKAPLELGPLNNVKYLAQNAAGNSTTESLAYAELQRAVQAATNLKTDAAKGVQTDKDVLRFANELIAAFGGNDTKASLEALSNFYKSTKKAEEDTKIRIDSRRTSQGVQPYYGATSGTAKNPIKLN